MELDVMKEPAGAKPNLKSPPIPPPQKASFMPQAMPPSMKRYSPEPEAIPVRTPVDPQALNIPDHLDVVKRPTDTSTIERKLHSGRAGGRR